MLDLIGKKSEKSGVVVVFDEFQELDTIAPTTIKQLRSTIQHHTNVCYIFNGSDIRILDIFVQSDQPFYKFGKTVNLERPNGKK